MANQPVHLATWSRLDDKDTELDSRADIAEAVESGHKAADAAGIDPAHRTLPPCFHWRLSHKVASLGLRSESERIVHNRCQIGKVGGTAVLLERTRWTAGRVPC
jgi:hypothetical protein